MGRKFNLNGRLTDRISSHLDDSEYIGKPFRLISNSGKSFIGSVVNGSGFILTSEQAETLRRSDPNNGKVLFRYLNGHDLNNSIDQIPTREIVNFWDWSQDYCHQQFPECFDIVERLVKPHREKVKRKAYRETWWQYAEKCMTLYKTIEPLKNILVVAQTSKTAAFCFVPNGYVYAMMCVVFAFDDYLAFSILQSSLHYYWAYCYGSTMKTDLRYTPSDIFETFPFPNIDCSVICSDLEAFGEQYHEFRRQLMLKMQLGLTKTYNQFHNPDLREFSEDDISKIPTLTTKESQKQYGKNTVTLWKHLDKTEGTCSFNEAVRDILHLRELHKHMDETVLRAYGWHEESKCGPPINLAHDFYEVDYLPENDRVHYTISPEAREEVLKRLLLLNHEIYEDEVRRGLHDKNKAKHRKGRTKAVDPKQIEINIQ